MGKQENKQAVGYLRVSSKGQIRGHGFDRQRDEIKRYAKKDGYEIVQWYKEAYTGTEEDRPEFICMVEDLLTNGCRTIIIECMDRFGRRSMVSEQLLALLIRKDIAMISAMTGQCVTADVQDENDPWEKFIVQIQSNFAELDKRLLVRKLRMAREAKKAKTGRCEGRKPYGFYPGEQDVIRRIRQLARKPHGEERLGCRAIARQLNKEGVRTRSGVPWSSTQVKSILSRKT
ncbi:recombinase family protein [Planctomycetota bacterium]